MHRARFIGLRRRAPSVFPRFPGACALVAAAEARGTRGDTRWLLIRIRKRTDEKAHGSGRGARRQG